MKSIALAQIAIGILSLIPSDTASAQAASPRGMFAQETQAMAVYLTRVQQGGKLSPIEEETVQEIWMSKTQVDLDNPTSEDADKLVDHYILSMQMALLNSSRHGGWPTRHACLTVSDRTMKALNRRFEQGDAKAQWASPYDLAATVLLGIKSRNYSFSYLALQLLKDRNRLVYSKTLRWIIELEPMANSGAAQSESFFSHYIEKLKEKKSNDELDKDGQWTVYIMYVRRALGLFLQEERAHVREKMYGQQPER